MRTALRLAAPVGATTLVLAVLLPIRVLPTTRVLAIWVVLLTAVALRELVQSFPRADERRTPRFEAALRNRSQAAPDTSVLPRMERDLQLSLAFADTADRTLFPLLRTAAAARLSMRYGVELERQPDVARRILGEQTWDFVRPDRPPPADGLGPGPREEEIAAVVARLETL